MASTLNCQPPVRGVERPAYPPQCHIHRLGGPVPGSARGRSGKKWAAAGCGHAAQLPGLAGGFQCALRSRAGPSLGLRRPRPLLPGHRQVLEHIGRVRRHLQHPGLVDDRCRGAERRPREHLRLPNPPRGEGGARGQGHPHHEVLPRVANDDIFYSAVDEVLAVGRLGTLHDVLRVWHHLHRGHDDVPGHRGPVDGPGHRGPAPQLRHPGQVLPLLVHGHVGGQGLGNVLQLPGAPSRAVHRPVPSLHLLRPFRGCQHRDRSVCGVCPAVERPRQGHHSSRGA
mmetsp:Transcript_111917/g.297482  ORF Transcript_111917/g.297482 Transcript_111917/m.297482 type:complete len:283 (-) Transcript_111917:159-1007(-)